MTTEIQILSSEVVDQIAAGEVVERPAHLVKELVENSIDAGATHVVVEIADAARAIKVTDNGHGIRADQLAKALDRFGTSKIKVTDDLWRLQTYGFRGEALASISAVSELSIISRTENSEHASKLESQFGSRGEVQISGGAKGTGVHIKNLFGNVPARLKFMKSAASEYSAIKNVFKAMSLAHPHVEFQLFNNSQLDLLFSKATSKLQRAEQVLGVTPLYEGEAARGHVRTYAVFGSPMATAKSSKNIWIFAQERWIQDRSVQAAVMEAYRQLLMHGEFPQVALWIEADPAEIDVNIHPTKSQVKFADSSLVFRSVQAAIRQTLEQAPWLPKFTSSNASVGSSAFAEQNPAERFTQVASAAFQNTTDAQASSPAAGFVAPVVQSTESLKFEDISFQRTQYQQKDMDFVKAATESKQARQDLGFWSQLQVLGQANLTYIIAQSAGSLYLVDQHAAHERVNWERLMSAWRGGQIEVQDYLFPLTLDLSHEKLERIMSFEKDLSRLGFAIEQLGPGTMGVKSAPLFLKEKSIVAAIECLSDESMSTVGVLSLEKMIGDIVATLACHSSVRAGQALSMDEMQSLLLQMDLFPLSSFCPHGRPVYKEITFVELDRDFGRLGS